MTGLPGGVWCLGWAWGAVLRDEPKPKGVEESLFKTFDI